MKTKSRMLAIAAVIVAAGTIPARSGAQPETQPYVFFGDEASGGSYLGVDTRDVTTERMGALHLKEESGVEITMVDQDAPAGKAGLKEHDVILTLNDQKIEGVEQLRRIVHEIPAGRSDFSRPLGGRKGTAASVTGMLDRKEQNLSLPLPEPRRSGSLQSCDYVEAATCAEIINEGSKLAQVIPELTTAEIKRLKPQMEHLQKQIQEQIHDQMVNHSEEFKQEMEQLQRDLRDQQEDLRREVKKWVKESNI